MKRKNWKNFIIFILLVFFVPFFSFSQPKCCQLKHKIGPYNKGDIVGYPYYPTSYIGDCPWEGDINLDPGWSGYCTLDAVYTFRDWVMRISFIAVFSTLVLSSVFFVTSGGNPQQVAKAKKFLTFAVIGVLIGVGAMFIPSFIRFFLGV